MILVRIPWHVNPFRGDRFAEGWAHAAELVLDYGATSWAFYRSLDGRLDFIQHAVFPSKVHFERYWYSEEVAALRVQIQGYVNVPILPEFYEIVGEGQVLNLAPAEPS